MLGDGTTLLTCIFPSQTLYNALFSPLRGIPGPFSSRFTNLPLKFAVIGGRRVFHIDNLHKTYGPIVRLTPTEVGVGADVQAFKIIHGVSSKFPKNSWYEKLTNFPRPSVFTMLDIREHSARRRLFARGLSKTYLREKWEPAVQEKVAFAIRRIKAAAKTPESANLLKWWTFMSTDIIGVLGFGESFGLLEKGEKTEYIRVMEAALVGNGVGAELPWLRAILSWLPVTKVKEAFKSTAYILAHGSKAVDNARIYGKDANIMATIMTEGEKEGSRIDDLVFFND